MKSSGSADTGSQPALPALTETIASTATLRIAAIPESDYFCTPVEERFERITRVARHALNVPVAAVTLINGDRQWFKSVCGWPVSELPLDSTLCQITIAEGKLTTIGDTQSEPKTRGIPLVSEMPRFRAYAGYPIRDEYGHISGTFCVFDTKPRRFTQEDCGALIDLAVMAQRELMSEQLKSAHLQLASKLGISRREAMIDPLTRLWNRRGAMLMMEGAIEEACSKSTPLAVALMDLDEFKPINDTYGHQVGDEVLRKSASRLIRNIRMSDVVCRIGGDEFLLLMNDADTAAASQVADRLRKCIADTPVMTRQVPVPTSISIGYTIFESDEPVPVETLLERADSALIQAKLAGRNRVVKMT